MAQINKLTDRAIKAAWQAVRPHDSPVKLFDGGGLYLLLQPPKAAGAPGAAYWRLKYRVAGVEKSISLGVYPEVSLAKARARAGMRPGTSYVTGRTRATSARWHAGFARLPLTPS